MATNESDMTAMQKTTIHMQGEIKPLKSKLSGQTTKKTDASKLQHRKKYFK